MHLYAAKKGSRETWGRFRIIITHAAQSLLTHSRETANCSADVPAHLFLAPLDRRDGEGSIPCFSLAKLRITNATHSFPSAILQSLAGVTVEDTGGREIALFHPNGSLALGYGRLRRSKQTCTSSRSDHSHRNALGHSTQENLSKPEHQSLT